MIVTGWPMRMSCELHFLEIGVDPDIGQRHHRHQRRAGGDLLADLHGALGDHAVHRRDDAHMAKRDGGGAQLRLGRQHVGIVGDVGALRCWLGPGPARSARACDRGLRRRHRIAGMGQFLARHRTRRRRLWRR